MAAAAAVAVAAAAAATAPVLGNIAVGAEQEGPLLVLGDTCMQQDLASS